MVPLWYILSSLTGFLILNIGFGNISKLNNVNYIKNRYNVGGERFLQQEASETANQSNNEETKKGAKLKVS